MILGVGGDISAQLGHRLVDLRQAIDRLELEFSETAAAFAATDQWREEGWVSPIQWLRVECKMASGAAADRICVGEHVGRLARSVEAVSEGRIGFAHLALIAQTEE